MYSPSFFEIFLALSVIAGWSWWLEPHRLHPRLAWVSRAVIGIVVLGQLLAFASTIVATTPLVATQMLLTGRWGSVFAIVAGGCILALLTLVVLFRGRPT